MSKNNKSRIFSIEAEKTEETSKQEKQFSENKAVKIFLFYLPLTLLLFAILGVAGYSVYQNGLPWMKKTAENQQVVPSEQEKQKNNFQGEQASAEIALPIEKEIPENPQLQQAVEQYKRGYSSQAEILFDKIINSSAVADVKSYAHIYAGILADQAGRYNLALDHYAQALKLLPDSFYAYYNKAITLQKKGEIDLAMQALEKAQKLRPNRTDVTILKGQLEFDREDYEQAQKTLETAKQEPRALYNLGLVYKKEGKLAEAKTSFLEALEMAVTGEVAVQSAAQLGILLATQGDYQNAKNYFERAVNLSPANARYYYNLALVQYHLGEQQEAVKNLEQSVSLGGGDQKTFLYIASLYTRMGMMNNAKKSLLQGLEKAPHDMQLLGQLADLQIHQHDWSSALNTLETMESLATGLLEKSKVLYNLGKVYGQMRDFSKAQDYLERAYKLDSSNEDALIALGKIHQQNGNAHKSIELYREALRINPDNKKILRELSHLYNQLGLTAEAENSLKRLLQHPLRTENDMYYAYNSLGIIYKQRKAYDTALQYFEKSFTAKDEELRYQALLQAADVSLLADKPSDLALGYLQKAVAMRPQDNAARLLLVKTYLRDGSATASERAEEEAITIMETEKDPALLSKALTMRGIVYYRQGLFERALDMFNRALELDSSNQEAFANKQAAAGKL